MAAMRAAYLAAAVLAAASTLGVRFRRPGLAALTLGLAAAVCAWNLWRFLVDLDDTVPGLANAILLVLAEIAGLLVFLIAARLVLPRWRMPSYLIAALVGFPVVVLVLASAGVGLAPDNFRSGVLYAVHLAYGFANLVACVSLFTQRQNDPSRHVRVAVRLVQVDAVVILILVSTVPVVTSIVSVPFVLIAVWISRNANEWDRSATPADRLLDTIGVFVFVSNDEGELVDWNGPGAALLRLRGHDAERGLHLADALGLASLRDRRIADLEIAGGTLRTELTVHPVDPLARDRDYVLMFRPTGSSLTSSPFPTVSGELEGHDPSTQTLGRRAAADHVRAAAVDGDRVLRVDVHGRRNTRPDDLMFLVARRLEARSSELGWPDLEWARLNARAFVAVVRDNPPDAAIPMRVDVDDLGISISVTPFEPRGQEDPDAFLGRVTANPRPRDVAHGS